MPPREFKNLKFPRCCRNILEDIKKRQELGEQLRRLVAMSPFITMFGGLSVPEMLVSLHDTDWEVFGRAVKVVPTIVRNRCATVAGLHALEHSGDLQRFWSAMHDSFSKAV